MSESTTKSRARGGTVLQAGGEKKESPIATNLLTVAGKGGAAKSQDGKSQTKKSPTGKPENGKTDKNPAKDQKTYWLERIKLVTEAIGFDISALNQMPGMDVAVTSWKKQLDDATAPQKDGRWQDSHTKLAELQTRLHESVNTHRTEGLKALKDSVNERKKYEQYRSEISEMQSRIDAYPNGAAELDAKFSGQLKLAEQLYEKNKFGLAAKEIDTARDMAKGALKALDGRDDDAKSLVSPLKDTYSALTKLDALIDQKEDALGSAAVKTYRDGSTTIYKAALDAMKGGIGGPLTKLRDQQNVVNKALLLRVGTLQEQLLAATKDIDAQATKAGQLVVALRKKITDGAEVRNQSEVDEAYTSLRSVENLVAARDFKTAIADAVTLGGELRSWQTLPSDQKERAQAVKNVADSKFQQPAREQLQRALTLEAAAKTTPVLNTPPAAADTVAMLKAQLQSYEEFPQAFPVSEGLDVLKRATAANVLNEQRKTDYEALSGERKRLNSEIAQAAQAVEQSMTKFKGLATTGGEDVKRLPSYEKERDAALDLWKTEADRATKAEQLPAEAVKAMLKTLRDKIDLEAKDPTKLGAAGLESRLAELNEAFGTASKFAKAAVDVLGELNYETGDAQATALSNAGKRYADAMKKPDPAAAQAAIDAITKIKDEAERSVRGMAATLKQAKDAWMDMFGAVRDMLNGLYNSAQKKPLQDYAAVVKTMMTEHASIGTVHVSKDASVLKASTEELRNLNGEAQKMEAMFRRLASKLNDVNDPSIVNLQARATQLTKAFDKDKLVKAREAQGLTDIKAKLKTITDAIGTAKLADSDKQLSDLQQEWTALQKTALDHEAQVNAFVLEVDTELAAFNTRQEATTFPSYAASVVKRLNALKSSAADGTVDDKGLLALKQEIANTGLHTSSLERADGRAQTEELQEQLSQKKWKADYGAFKGKVKSLALIKKGIADPEKKTAFEQQLDQIVDSAAQVAKGEGKNTYASMCEQLQALVRNINNLINYPMGLETHARGQILETVKDWNDAVTNFHKVVGDLAAAVGTAMDGDPRKNEVVTAVDARVEQAKQLLQTNTIDPSARAVMKAGDDKDAARDAREQALREVKRLQRIVEGPALRPFAENKFDVPVMAALGNMSARLFNVETNLVISL